MRDVEKAKGLLVGGKYTCVLCRGEEILTSERTGIAPMMGFIGSGADLRGYSVADRIVGKAAALLFVLAGIKEVYADVLSDSAAAVMEAHGIPYEYGVRTAHIVNRTGDGICPMEMTVNDIEEPGKAYAALAAKIEEMRKP